MEEKIILSATTAQIIMAKLQQLPYMDVQPILDELSFALRNSLLFTLEQYKEQEKMEERPIGFIRDDDDDEDTEDKINKNK